MNPSTLLRPGLLAALAATIIAATLGYIAGTAGSSDSVVAAPTTSVDREPSVATAAVPTTLAPVDTDSVEVESVEPDTSAEPSTPSPVTDYPVVEPATDDQRPTVHYPTVHDPLADLTTGELLGHPIGTPSALVLESLAASVGPIDDHGGWGVPCGIEELSVSGGGFWVRFVRDEDGDRMTGWELLVDGPMADRVSLPGEAIRTMSMTELAESMDWSQSITVIPSWDHSRLDIAGPGTNAWFTGTEDLDEPATVMGHGATYPECYDV